MTTLAVNKDQIAADRMVNHAGMQYRIDNKLFYFEQPDIHPVPFVVGISGQVDVIFQTLEYFADPEGWTPPKNMDKAEFLVLTAKKKIFLFNDPRKWHAILSPFYALGSGCHFAMGAMQCGKTPEEAVAIAAKLDKGTGNGVTVHEF